MRQSGEWDLSYRVCRPVHFLACHLHYAIVLSSRACSDPCLRAYGRRPMAAPDFD